jgi:hypothetical protein
MPALGCGDDTSANFLLDMSMSAPMVRRMADIPVRFQLQGLWWDGPTQALYAANDSGQIVRFDDDTSAFSVVGSMPLVAAGAPLLGQLVKLKDGSWLVTAFGSTGGTSMPTTGALIKLAPDGTISTIPNLDSNRRRIGLTIAPDGTLFDGWFIAKPKVGPQMGTVSKVDISAGTETDLVMSIGKPVGVLAAGTSLYVSDQLNNVVLSTPLATPGTTTSFASIMGPDALAAGPSGTIFAVTNQGNVYQLGTTGMATEIKGGYKALRGVAYDGDHKRLFVSEPDGGTPDGGAGMPMLHILPID